MEGASITTLAWARSQIYLELERNLTFDRFPIFFMENILELGGLSNKQIVTISKLYVFPDAPILFSFHYEHFVDAH